MGLILRLFRSDWRSGELRLLALSLGLAVAAVTAVDFLTERAIRLLESQGAELLAADLALEHSAPPAGEILATAKSLGLQTARILSFPSVVMGPEEPVLVQVKGVDGRYPLRGELRLSDAEGTGESVHRAPAVDEAWVEPGLLGRLGTRLGDRIEIGAAEFRLTRLIEHEPDRGGNLFRLAPRVMLSTAGIERAELLGPASRVRYRLLAAGEPDAVERLRRWIDTELPRGANLLTVQNAQPELRSAIQRGRSFLHLAALCAVLLAGAASALVAHLFVKRQLDAAAMMRCLGATSGRIGRIFVGRLLLLGLSAGLFGALLGYLAQAVLLFLIGDWFDGELPQPSWRPLLNGLLVGLVLLGGFGLPALVRLRRVPPLRVLRRDLQPAPLSAWLAWALALGSFAALVFWLARDPALAERILASLFGAGLVLLLGARALTALAAGFRRHTRSAWRYGLAALARRPGLSSLQTGAFGLGLLALLLIGLVRGDLLQAWEQSLPPGTPDHFLINIQADEVETLASLLRDKGIDGSGLYPMIRGRLVRINDREITPEDYESIRARRLAAREFNLSTALELQSDNRIVAGHWWGSGSRDTSGFSVEQGIAETLGMALNDRLVFDVAGQRVSGRITSLREVQWDSFNVNFFVIGTPELMRDLPATFITSFYLPGDRKDLLRELARTLPAVSVIDVKPLIAQVKNIMQQGSRAIQTVFLFTLAAGVLVLLAAVQVSRDERSAEIAVLRTLGARRRFILVGLLTEFAVLGLTAGVLAAGVATVTGYVLATGLFDLPWQLNPWLWLLGTAGGALLVASAGMLATRPLINAPPVRILQGRFA